MWKRNTVNMNPSGIIYTIGTSQRSMEDFIELLNAYTIRAVADVRSVPRSKFPYFSSAGLRTLLQNNGIAYHYLGTELGGFRKGGYPAYTLTPSFSHGIDRLETLARADITVVACAERFPWKCHRRWIAMELQKRGWAVSHIIDKGKVWTPQ